MSIILTNYRSWKIADIGSSWKNTIIYEHIFDDFGKCIFSGAENSDIDIKVFHYRLWTSRESGTTDDNITVFLYFI